MCANYIPVTRLDRLLAYFGVTHTREQPEHEVFPGGLAPFIRLALRGGSEGNPGELQPVVNEGIFRFIPDFVAKVDWARKTYNARSETVDIKATYRDAWAAGQRCIIPGECIYEPNHESGSPVRWRISLATGAPMGIAGIYRTHINAEGQVVFSMSMLTVNADDHPFMKRFHAPGHEKRMVVILDPRDFEGWLKCPVGEARATYCKPGPHLLDGVPAPLPPRPKGVGVPRPRAALPTPPSTGIGKTGDLF
jgi:putative SOS response-associated peptidase YedK